MPDMIQMNPEAIGIRASMLMEIQHLRAEAVRIHVRLEELNRMLDHLREDRSDPPLLARPDQPRDGFKDVAPDQPPEEISNRFLISDQALET